MRDKDLKLNEVGDIEIGPDGDLAIVRDDDVRVQDIRFRLQTYAGDYELEPACGASLEDFIGQPNTPLLGGQIEERVMDALTHDGLFLPDELTVRVSPLSQTALIVGVVFKGRRGNYTVLSSLDLMTGKLQVEPGT